MRLSERMLEISKVQFLEKADEHRQTVTRIIGGIKMVVEICVDEQDQVPRKVIHDALREQIWHNLYGDLRKPLSELQSLALHEVRPEYGARVQALCEQLNALLAFKSLNFDDPASG